MTKEEEYNILKDKIIEVFQNYIRVIDKSQYSDLRNPGANIELLDAYIKVLRVNSELVFFITKNKI